MRSNSLGDITDTAVPLSNRGITIGRYGRCRDALKQLRNALHCIAERLMVLCSLAELSRQHREQELGGVWEVEGSPPKSTESTDNLCYHHPHPIYFT